MGYQINPSLGGELFSVPKAVVQRHIRLASHRQLQVLLWVLCNADKPFDEDGLCGALRYPREDVLDYLQYWVETGVLVTDSAAPLAVSVTPSAPEPKKEVREPLPVLPLSKPTAQQIALRSSENPDIGFLLNDSQKKLGRTIGYDGQCVLLMLHDTYGLPIEVILMLVEYCASTGKTSNAYLSCVGRDWAEKEIDSIEKADALITSLRTRNALWAEFSALAGIGNPRPTSAQEQYLGVWSTQWGFNAQMIYLAYEEMANHCQKISYAYMNKVLSNWHEKGISTPDGVDSAQREKKTPATAPTAKPQREASYDLDEYNRRALEGPPDYKKVKKK